MRALALAAAAEAGLRPTIAKQASRVTIRVSKPNVFSRLEVESADGDRVRRFECEHIPDRGILHILRAAIRNVALWAAAADDLKYIYPTPETLFGFRDTTLLFESRVQVGSFDVASGALRWYAAPESHQEPIYTARSRKEEGLVLYQCRPRFQTVPLSAGRPFAVVRGLRPHPWSFEFADERGWLVVAGETQLGLYEQGKPRWTYSAGSPLTCGPLLVGDRAVVGGENGDLQCFRLDRRCEMLWTSPLAERLYGPLTHIAGPHEVVLAASQEGTLFAVSVADGRRLWRADLGDRIVGAPVWLDGGIAVASGTGGVKVLDHNTGAVLKQRTHPVALKHFVAAGQTTQCLVASDVEGTTWFLSGPDLRVRRKLKMPVLSCLMAASRLPAGLGDAEEMVAEREPVVLGADGSGVLYFMSVPGR